MMRCPLCGGSTRLVRSEPIVPGATKHVRACMAPLGHKPIEFETVEMLHAASSRAGSQRFAEDIEAAVRGLSTRTQSAERRAAVADLLKAGRSVRSIAREVGITGTRVRQIRAELSDGEARDGTLKA